ncbi:protein of unknown function [Streptococcus thermophilus]|nr:protein of unknown function [Streptococcus thermophilus]CAD0158001.1 protein of unknown function [Streptococcus thermophilus]CAD0160253.1 protein of unknown function [Streptococcus thermophilus]CAD0160903.1 protein of unknown function [Streptococcus thermophilus]CAD0172776.1 protein of unknown function [Streptococcus thermophilus]
MSRTLFYNCVTKTISQNDIVSLTRSNLYANQARDRKGERRRQIRDTR